MRPILTGSALTAALFLISLAACKKEEPPAQSPQGYPPPGYQQQPAPYGQPAPGQPAPTMAPAPGAPAPAPAAPAPAAGTAGMNPNPQGPPCTNDSVCGTGKCNVPAGKCSWPCQGPADCLPGMQCITPICVPMLPGAAPAPTK